MSHPHLPPEILYRVIDHLHDEPEALKGCCLASKSCVPRTRKHLFANIRIRSAGDLESWLKTFPDVATSPACHARTLFIGCLLLVVAADAKDGGWIQSFSGVTSLDVDNGDWHLRPSEVSLTPLYKFSSTLKSLRMCPIFLSFPQLFNLIRSLPLLEDLSLSGHDHGSFGLDDDPPGSQTVIPLASPSFTGFLDLNVLGGLGKIAHQLLESPNGLHFRKIALSWDRPEDARWITELVVGCSHTLESLDVAYDTHGTSIRICTGTNNLILFSWDGVNLVRPLKSDKTTRRGSSTPLADR